MCTLGRTSAKPARKTDNKPDWARLPAWNGQKRNDDGAKRCRCHFLTTPIHPIAPQHVKGGCGEYSYELITQENYEFLRDSYLCYVQLMGVSPNHTPGKSLGEGINNVYNELMSLVGEKPNLNIEEDGGRLFFNLWDYYEWGRYVVYYFPVKFIEKLNPRLRKIAISFIHDLMHANGISTIMDEYDLEIVLDWILNEEYQNQEEADAYKKIIYSYTKGKAAGLLDTVWKKSYYNNLDSAIKRYVPQNGFESSIIDAMKEGMEFIRPAKGIMEYAYDPFRDEGCDCPPIMLERQIRVVYDIDDIVATEILNYFNCEQRETYEIVPVECFPLSPKTDRLFSKNDKYPERFFRWAGKFIDIIS